MSKDNDKKYSLKDIQGLWALWCNDPMTLYRRKSFKMPSEIKGGPEKIVGAIGEIVFTVSFPEYINVAEQLNENDKDKKLKEKFFPKK